jgi:Tfp pilus assembly protein PilO
MNNNGFRKEYLRYKDFFLNVLSVYNQKPNFKKYLELALSLTAIIIFSVFAIKPTVLTIISLNKEITAKEEMSAKLKQKIRNLQSASNLLQSSPQNIELINQAVPEKAVPEKLIEQLEVVAQQNSLKLLGFNSTNITILGTPSPTKKSKDIVSFPNGSNELTFTFSATGTYQDIYNFVSSLENMRRPIKFDSFVINSNINDSGKIIVLTVLGRVPYKAK